MSRIKSTGRNLRKRLKQNIWILSTFGWNKKLEFGQLLDKKKLLICSNYLQNYEFKIDTENNITNTKQNIKLI